MSKTNCQAGYTLLELLLVVLLVLLFTGAAVMNVAPLAQGARLDEGVGQLETLLRFARAEAAQQGRRHQLQIQAASEAQPASRAAIAVRWEPEPLQDPGVFVQRQSTAALAQSVTEHVRSEHVRLIEPASPSAHPPAARDAWDMSAPASEPPGAPAFGAVEEWPSITFYPDGSSDSAEILVGSTDINDPRLMLVKWNGLSGSTAREGVNPESLGLVGSRTAEAQPLEPASVAHTILGPSAP